MAATLRNRKQQNSHESAKIEEITSKGEESYEDSYEIVTLVQKSTLTRLDVGPFLILYTICLASDQRNFTSTLTFLVSMILHLTVVLLSQWRTNVRALVGYNRTSKPFQWTHCYVHNNAENTGDIVAIQKEGTTVAHFTFHDICFRYSTQNEIWQPKATSTQRFQRIMYPDNEAIQFYQNWKGYATLEDTRKAERLYGPNTTVLKLPTFFDLLSEQLVAPFFLFQVFCVFLWSLDEYWYYAIMTLVSLGVFESTLAFNRLKGLQRLHQAGHKGRERIWVKRATLGGSDWMSVLTKELIPGDYVSISTRGHGTTIPADIVIVAGSAVADEALLTGESVPQIKQSLGSLALGHQTKLDTMDSQHKESILFGGTTALVTNGSEEKSEQSPDGGVCGIVIRTGFETAQGDLLRTMAYSSKNADAIHTWDTFVFIVILILCAVGAAAWVLNEGWHDERRNRFRLLLHVIIIITSVVPPELPMELSLAVTNSVATLVKRSQVYCTELFRIPWAGEVNVCCFDKTGTITSDEMLLSGVRLFVDQSGEEEDEENLLVTDPDKMNEQVCRIMAGCHSLAVTGGPNRLLKVIGDPLESVILKESGFRLIAKDMVEHSNNESTLMILRRFAFSSKVKRMSTVVSEKNDDRLWLLTKGAPETIKDLLAPSSMPDRYDEVAFHHMSRGRRVLAMAYRQLGTRNQATSIKAMDREDAERDLIFAGFLVLQCPLKPDSKSVIAELRKSDHAVVMITGDALLTAVEVSRQVSLVSKAASNKVYQILRLSQELDSLCCVLLGEYEVEGTQTLTISMEKAADLVDRHEAAFCLEGATILQIALDVMGLDGKKMSSIDEKHILLKEPVQRVLSTLVPFISVFGRHTPHQKEAVIAAFNRKGCRTLMIGDGTNDVGALKRAHVGISIVSAPEVEAKQRKANEKMKQLRKQGKKAKSSFDSTLRELHEAQDELEYVELGDASVAAPFTSRSVSIRCCRDVIQQGRCTLVTMLQIYKILGINCLVNAMVLSSLFLHGVKQGDRQLTALGIVVAALFYFVTRAEPVPVLSKDRPPKSVLCAQALITILFQFLIHMAALAMSTEVSALYVDPFDPSIVPDGPFNPNLLNSSAFLLTCLTTVNTFAVNYRGRPFMKDLRENKLLFRALQGCYAVIFLCVFELFPPLNDLLQLSPFPQGPIESSLVSVPSFVEGLSFPVFLGGLMLLDTVLCFGVESIVLRYIP